MRNHRGTGDNFEAAHDTCESTCGREHAQKSLRRKMAFSSRADLRQGTAAQEVLNPPAHSIPNSNSNSDYIGWPAHSAAQCKRLAQYSPYWVGLVLLATSMKPIISRRRLRRTGNDRLRS